MKRWIILLAAGLLGGSSIGCMMTPWSPDPTIRAQQLVLVSEGIRMSGNDLSGLLLLSQPTTLTPIPGGQVGP